MPILLIPGVGLVETEAGGTLLIPGAGLVEIEATETEPEPIVMTWVL